MPACREFGASGLVGLVGLVGLCLASALACSGRPVDGGGRESDEGSDSVTGGEEGQEGEESGSGHDEGGEDGGTGDGGHHEPDAQGETFDLAGSDDLPEPSGPVARDEARILAAGSSLLFGWNSLDLMDRTCGLGLGSVACCGDRTSAWSLHHFEVPPPFLYGGEFPCGAPEDSFAERGHDVLIFEEHGSNAPAAEAEPIVAAAQLESKTQFDVYLFAMWPLFDEGQFEAWLAGELTQGYTLTSEFRDELAALDPPAEIYLIPMDPLFRELVVDGPLAGLTFHDLFVGDDALSAGSATTDFVKALVVYMGVFRRKPSVPLTVPEDVHPAVDQNQGELVDVIWDRLVLEGDRLGF